MASTTRWRATKIMIPCGATYLLTAHRLKWFILERVYLRKEKRVPGRCASRMAHHDVHGVPLGLGAILQIVSEIVVVEVTSNLEVYFGWLAVVGLLVAVLLAAVLHLLHVLIGGGPKVVDFFLRKPLHKQVMIFLADVLKAELRRFFLRLLARRISSNTLSLTLDLDGVLLTERRIRLIPVPLRQAGVAVKMNVRVLLHFLCCNDDLVIAIHSNCPVFPFDPTVIASHYMFQLRGHSFDFLLNGQLSLISKIWKLIYFILDSGVG